MPDDVLSRAAQRAREVWPGYVGKYMSMLMGWAGQQRWPSVPRQIADKLAAAVLSLPVSTPDRDALVDVLLFADSSYDMVAMHEDTPDGYGLVEHLADALISAGLVRTPGPALDREALGQKVREVWIDWASEQPNPKASWLVPWEGLSEPDREVDRRIGEALAAVGRASVRTPVTAEQIERATQAAAEADMQHEFEIDNAHYIAGNNRTAPVEPDTWSDLCESDRADYRRMVRAAVASLGLSVVEGDA